MTILWRGVGMQWYTTNMTSPLVIVVGTGNAALVAALAAHDRGAQVLVIEAASKELRGGNSRFSGGIFRFVHEGAASLAPLVDRADNAGRYADVLIPPYTRDEYLDDVMRAGHGRPDSALVSLLVERSRETVEWMQDRGVRWELTVGKLIDRTKLAPNGRYELPAGGAVRSVGEGVGLVDDLFAAVDRAGIEIKYESPAASLITQGSTVVGVRIRHRNRFTDVRGTAILASGGFESNPEMRLRYLGPGWDLVKVRGTRFNQGTMIQAALLAGAQPAGHWEGCHAVPLDADAPAVGDLRLTDKLSRYSYPYGILVNRDGQRFIDEGEDQVWLTYAKTGAAILRQPGAVAFQIFDQQGLELLEPRYVTGTPVTGDTIEELAMKLAIEPSALRETLDGFNTAAPANATFDAFRLDGVRTNSSLEPPKSNWARRMIKPPFVGYRVTCGITFTYGGIAIDTDARVLDTEGRPMPGFYAAGEVTGGFFFHNYPAGAGLMRGAVFGRIAGERAAAYALGER
jgi:tricarballylate dehydrogenase